MNINLELCKIFAVVAEELNISQASKKLYISQPAVSQSIKKLENELGGILFLRSNKGLTLTAEGANFYNYVKGAMTLLNNAAVEFNQFKGLKTGTLRIGASTTLTKIILMEPISQFHKKYLDIRFQIQNDLTKNLLLDLEKGKLDFVLMNEGDGIPREFHSRVLKELKNGWLCKKGFADDKKVYSLEEIIRLPLILQNNHANSRKFLDKILAENNLTATPEMQVVSQELCLELAKIGMGVTFAPVEYAENLIQLKVKTAMPSSKVLLVTNQFYSLSFAAETFLSFLK